MVSTLESISRDLLMLREADQERSSMLRQHILVMYAGSMRAPENITRTKEEAKSRIEQCVTRYGQGEEFDALAREYSDGPSATSGGDLGEFPKGVMHPAFEQATFACEIGSITDVVETPFGYHVIYRYK